RKGGCRASATTPQAPPHISPLHLCSTSRTIHRAPRGPHSSSSSSPSASSSSPAPSLHPRPLRSAPDKRRLPSSVAAAGGRPLHRAGNGVRVRLRLGAECRGRGRFSRSLRRRRSGSRWRSRSSTFTRGTNHQPPSTIHQPSTHPAPPRPSQCSSSASLPCLLPTSASSSP
ncbi:hypothetical protein T484DRAFT_1908029, partial [Baffinella frigidus]